MLTLGSRILEEQFYDVNVLRAGEGVTANADNERLAESNASRLRDGLIGERTRARHDTCGAVNHETYDWASGRDKPMRPGVWMAPG